MTRAEDMDGSRIVRRAVLGTALLLALAGCREDTDRLPPVGEDRVAAEEIACVAGGGRWGTGPTPGVMVCYRTTDDGGEACKAAGDCEGFCLARSQTCAPVTPLYGCNDVLGVGGAPSTVCVE